jgi:hypothetical protein
MSDINDIEGIIQRDKDRIYQLEITYKERLEVAFTKMKSLVEGSDVVKRLDEITDYINSKQDTNWKTEPFIGSYSFKIAPDSETFVNLEENKRKKIMDPMLSLQKDRLYVLDAEARSRNELFDLKGKIKEIENTAGIGTYTSVYSEFQYIAQTKKPLWGSPKVSFMVDITISDFNIGKKSYWSYTFANNFTKNGGLSESEFWKDFKNEIAERYN